MGKLSPRDLSDQFSNRLNAAGLGELVDNANPFALGRRLGKGELNASNRVLNIDESPRLAAFAMDSQRVAVDSLNQEPVEHGAIVSIIVEPVDQRVIEAGFFRLGAPDDSLMQIGDPQPVIAGSSRGSFARCSV